MPRASAALASLLALASVPAAAAEGSLFLDPTDGAFDLDRFLASRHGFVPVASPVTEPAVGLGLAGGLVFLHGPLGGAQDAEGRRIPPGVTAAVGMFTSNGSWAAGGGHLGHWRQGSIRYAGGAAYTSLRLTAYGAADQELAFTLDSVPVVQDLTFRLGDGELFAGARYLFIGSTVSASGSSLAAIEGKDLETRLSGLGPVLRWDGRDSIFSPSRGVRAEAAVSWFAGWLGSDRDGWKGSVKQVSYAPLAPWLVGALRLDLQVSGGDLPFWFRPFILLRGVPMLRYQGRHVAVAETEERIDLTQRWSAVVFAGFGVAAATPQPTTAWNAGTGFRYLLARQFNVRAGVDLARGPEQWAGYVIFGNAWN
jgi:hypothetical protein